MNKIVENKAKCKVDLAKLKDYPRNGIHHHHMVLASYCKGVGVHESEAVHLLHNKYKEKPQRRTLQLNEIENAVANAYKSSPISIKTFGQGIVVTPQFEKTSSDSFWNNEMPLPKEESSPLAIKRAISATPWSLEDMFEDSPFRLWKCEPAEILNLLFDPTDLICCGSVSRFMTRTTEEWLKEKGVGEQIVPNPSRVREGINKQGKPSVHCRDATGERRYIVIESDDESLSFNEKASLIRYLRDEARAELKMVVHSGGKSLHGWFKATGDSHLDYEFMKVACILGADPRMWLPEQLARTPNAVREEKNLIQKTLYVDHR